MWKSSDTTEIVETRQVFLRIKFEELTKKRCGLPYDEALVVACEAYLLSAPKPRVTVYANGNYQRRCNNHEGFESGMFYD